MKKVPDIRFVGVQPSATFASAAEDHIAKLELFCPAIVGCHVTFSIAHKHRHRGRPFGVRVNATLPGHELTVSRVENENVYLALAEAFDDMTRQVEDVMRRMREPEKHRRPALADSDLKDHESPT